MSSVKIPFQTPPPVEAPKAKGVEVSSALDGKVKLISFEGSFEVWHNGVLVLGPTSKEAAQVRFDRIVTPTCPEPEPVSETTEPAELSVVPPPVQCPACKQMFSGLRKQLLGTDLCPKCTPQADKPLGVMDFSHKTAGVLMVINDPELFRVLKKPINQQR